MVTTGFEGDDKGSAVGPITGLCQGTNLRMRFTNPRVKSFPPTLLSHIIASLPSMKTVGINKERGKQGRKEDLDLEALQRYSF